MVYSGSTILMGGTGSIGGLWGLGGLVLLGGPPLTLPGGFPFLFPPFAVPSTP
jgi:hypothetical protein